MRGGDGGGIIMKGRQQEKIMEAKEVARETVRGLSLASLLATGCGCGLRRGKNMTADRVRMGCCCYYNYH